MTPLEKAMFLLFGDKNYVTKWMDEPFILGESMITPNALIEAINKLETLA